MTLTDRQRLDLHNSIFDYLQSNNFLSTANQFIQDTNLEPSTNEKYKNLLEKKWTTVFRLQKKVSDLEIKLSECMSEMKTISNPHNTKKSCTDWIPRTPVLHTLISHRSPITRVIFHPIFGQCVSASEDHSIKFWDFENGEYEKTLKGHTSTVQDVRFNHNGTLLISCSSDLTIKLWNVSSEQCTKTFRGHEHNISAVDFIPGDNHIISASRDRTIKIWEISSGYCTQTFDAGHGDWIRMVRVSSDGIYIASCSNDKSVRITATENLATKCILIGHEHVVECINWSVDGVGKYINATEKQETCRYIVSGSRDKSIRIWDISTSQCVLQFNGHDDWIRSVTFQMGGMHLLSCSDDKTVKIWDIKNRRCIKTIEAHDHFVTTIAIHPKLPFVITGSIDKTVKVWGCR